jgi:hypothetical protein
VPVRPGVMRDRTELTRGGEAMALYRRIWLRIPS